MGRKETALHHRARSKALEWIENLKETRMHVSDLTSVCGARPGIVVQAKRKCSELELRLTGTKSNCDSRPEDIIFRRNLGYGGAGIEVGYLSQKHKKKE